MNLRHAAALAVLLASCSPDMSAINAATQRAEAVRQRAETAAASAEQSADLATEAYKSTRTADSGERLVAKGSAQESAMKANDVEAQWEAGASCSHGISDVSGHPYPCKPLSTEDWKWIDSRVKELNPNLK